MYIPKESETLDLESLAIGRTVYETFKETAKFIESKFDNMKQARHLTTKGRARDVKRSFLDLSEEILIAPPRLTTTYMELIRVLSEGSKVAKKTEEGMQQVNSDMAQLISIPNSFGGRAELDFVRGVKDIHESWLDYQKLVKAVMGSRDDSGRRQYGDLVNENREWDEIVQNLKALEQDTPTPKVMDKILDDTTEAVVKLRAAMDEQDANDATRSKVRESVMSMAKIFEAYSLMYYLQIQTIRCVEANIKQVTDK